MQVLGLDEDHSTAMGFKLLMHLCLKGNADDAKHAESEMDKRLGTNKIDFVE